jgi:hypothetical protein
MAYTVIFFYLYSKYMKKLLMAHLCLSLLHLRSWGICMEGLDLISPSLLQLKIPWADLPMIELRAF